MNEDDFVAASLMFNGSAPALELKVRAKRAVTLSEIQGDRGLIDACGATMPGGFSVKRFGEGVEIPDAMKDDLEFMNKSQFRWGMTIPLASGHEHTIVMPASGGQGRDKGVLTLAYEYPKLFGLLKGKGAIYVHFARS